MTTSPLRLFIALSVPSDTGEKLSRLIETLKQDNLPVKWVEKENLHWTLQFLGWTNSEQVENINSALTSATKNLAPFSLSLKQLDFFPAGRPRVIMITPDQGATELAKLQAKIRQALTAEGVVLEIEKPPHLTLGRVKKTCVVPKEAWQKKAKEVIAKLEPTEVKEVILFQSELQRGGPIYTKRLVCPFRG